MYIIWLAHCLTQFFEDLQKKAKMLMKFLRLTRELIWKEKSMSRCISVQQTRQQNSARKHSMLYVMNM